MVEGEQKRSPCHPDEDGSVYDPNLEAAVQATHNGNVVAVWHERLLLASNMRNVKILEKKVTSKKKKLSKA